MIARSLEESERFGLTEKRVRRGFRRWWSKEGAGGVRKMVLVVVDGSGGMVGKKLEKGKNDGEKIGTCMERERGVKGGQNGKWRCEKGW